MSLSLLRPLLTNAIGGLHCNYFETPVFAVNNHFWPVIVYLFDGFLPILMLHVHVY